ncbi:hypothetical protein ACLOJK_008371 [Asimina triloba]
MGLELKFHDFKARTAASTARLRQMAAETAVHARKLETTRPSRKYRLRRWRSNSSLTPLSLSCVENAEMKTRSPGKTPRPPLPSTHKQTPENNEEEEDELILQVLKPTGWLVQLIAFHFEAISSVFLAFLSMVYEPLHRAKESAEAAAKAVPARVDRGGGAVLRRLELGILGASHVFLVLVLVLVLAVFVGVGLVRWWAEEPLSLREPLHFDYTEVHPSAVVGAGVGGRGGGRKMKVLPVGHTLHVTVLLLMPESEYNRRIGVFQVPLRRHHTQGVLEVLRLPRSGKPLFVLAMVTTS